jgi:hypothetical protein
MALLLCFVHPGLFGHQATNVTNRHLPVDPNSSTLQSYDLLSVIPGYHGSERIEVLDNL